MQIVPLDSESSSRMARARNRSVPSESELAGNSIPFPSSIFKVKISRVSSASTKTRRTPKPVSKLSRMATRAYVSSGSGSFPELEPAQIGRGSPAFALVRRICLRLFARPLRSSGRNFEEHGWKMSAIDGHAPWICVPIRRAQSRRFKSKPMPALHFAPGGENRGIVCSGDCAQDRCGSSSCRRWSGVAPTAPVLVDGYHLIAFSFFSGDEWASRSAAGDHRFAEFASRMREAEPFGCFSQIDMSEPFPYEY